jgi:hypothetical protein
MPFKKTVNLTIKVVVETEDPNLNLDDVISELDYEVVYQATDAQIVYTELTDREILD